MRACVILTAALLASAGCDGAVEATMRPGGHEELPRSPTRPTPATALAPIVSPVESTEVQYASALASGEVLYLQGEDVMRWRLPPEPSERLGAAVDVGTISDVAEIGGTIVIAGSTGLRVVEAEGILESPASAGLGGHQPHLLAGSRRGAEVPVLWLLSASPALHFWRDGSISEVSLEGVDLGGARMAYGAELEGRPALWLAADGALFAITIAADGAVEAWNVLPDVSPNALAAAGDGSLWLAVDGDLQVRASDGTWTWYRLPTPVTEIRAASATGDAWITTEDGLWHGAAGTFRPIDMASMPVHTGSTVAAGGDLWMYGASGLTRALPRHHVALIGMGAGAIVAEAIEVSIEPDAPMAVTAVTAKIDGADAPVLESPRRVALDPAALGAGRHTLEVTVSYDDGTLDAIATAELIAITEPLTWTDDVQPIYDDRCSRCHGPSGPSPTRLDSADAWETRIDAIVAAVTSGRMPLGGPRLTPAEIGVIEAWAATGFEP